jgi:CheY-like chemotaxis protein
VPSISGQLRVLVAEDNADTAEGLRAILQSYGYEVTVVNSGPAAVEVARRFQPDAVLCDIGLPGLSGYEVARQLRADGREASPLLIAVTGYGTEADRLEALSAGFDAHFSKPVAPLALLAQLTARTGGKGATKH